MHGRSREPRVPQPPKQLFQVLVYDSYNILLLNHDRCVRILHSSVFSAYLCQSTHASTRIRECICRCRTTTVAAGQRPFNDPRTQHTHTRVRVHARARTYTLLYYHNNVVISCKDFYCFNTARRFFCLLLLLLAQHNSAPTCQAQFADLLARPVGRACGLVPWILYHLLNYFISTVSSAGFCVGRTSPAQRNGGHLVCPACWCT